MKLFFEDNLDYQLEAVNAVVGLFKGQEISQSEFSMSYLSTALPLGLKELGVGNDLTLTDEGLLKNLQETQKTNNVSQSSALHDNNFTIEMETGTGKTYVYLRTIFELNKHYGFTKFIIIVPSIAIKEGVYKTLKITHDHFMRLYPSARGYNYFIYDSTKLGKMRDFAESANIQIMVMTVGAINKKNINNIYVEQERTGGEKPIDLLKATNPIIIVDEPQSVYGGIGGKGKIAIEEMNPLCALRYSATHIDQRNMLYCLNAIEAYHRGLVKHIEVAGLEIEGDYNSPYIKLVRVSPNPVRATAEVFVERTSGVSRQTLTVNDGDLLQDITKMGVYKNMRIGKITRGSEHGETMRIVGDNIDKTLRIGESFSGADDDDVKRLMIRRTIKEHLDKEKRFKKQNLGVKVLSLFFIDRVEHYRKYNEAGDAEQGKYAKMFESEYKSISNSFDYKDLFTGLDSSISTSEVHDGYFSADKKGKWQETNEGNENGIGNAERAYNLIMKEKEKLLNLNEPLKFIFSHSALREGWDNPNVFQICYLRDVGTETARRQTIGRGLRLCVNQQGQRLTKSSNVNMLTVIAPESYASFAEGLQVEMKKETGIEFEKGSYIKNANKCRVYKIRKEVFCSEEFLNLWERIKHRTNYRVYFDNKKLKSECANAISQMEAITRQTAQFKKASIDVTQKGVSAKEALIGEYTSINGGVIDIPDIITELQNRTNLTRRTITDILRKCKRLEDFLMNPKQFIDNSEQIINEKKVEMLVGRVKYSKLEGKEYYTQEIFEARELITYLNSFIETKKSLYDITIYDSDIEKNFAEDLDKHESVKVFTKLPRSFTVPTPLGTYNPDWAIVMNRNGNDKLYLVAETKGSTQSGSLRSFEKGKIECSEKHFDAIGSGVDNPVQFKVANTLEGLIKRCA